MRKANKNTKPSLINTESNTIKRKNDESFVKLQREKAAKSY
jgi:hypothetical protein